MPCKDCQNFSNPSSNGLLWIVLGLLIIKFAITTYCPFTLKLKNCEKKLFWYKKEKYAQKAG